MYILKQTEFKKNTNKKFNIRLVINNSLITLLLKVFVLSYGIIRTFLINKYLGVSSFGILNIMMTFTPLALIFISASNDYSIFRVLKNKNSNKNILNRIINEQIIEIRKSGIISLFFVGLLMVMASFVFKSNYLTNWMTILFIASNSIDILMFAFVVPYTQWYLNANYKNYIYEFLNILLSTLANLASFILISLFGIGIIYFNNTNHETGALYILLCVNFLLGFRVGLSTLILNLMKRKYLPWFKKEKIKNNFFKKNQLYSYILRSIVVSIAASIIPIILFVISSFIPNISTLSGIYFSYWIFFSVFGIIQSVTASLVPFLENKLNTNIKEINHLIFSINFLIIIFLAIFYVGVVPFFSLIINNYLSFYLILILLFSFSILALNTIDENLIYLDGRPEKYLWLTFFEIIITLISDTIGFLIIFHVQTLIQNSLNILFCLTISDLLARLFKHFANIYYLSKIVYRCKTFLLFKNKLIYYFIYIITFVFIVIFMTSKFANNIEAKYTLPLPGIFSKNLELKQYINDDLKNINWSGVILITLFVDITYLALICYLVYIFDKNMKKIFDKLFFHSIPKIY